VFVAQHPKETAKAVWQSISDSWENDVVNGDVSSRSKWFGRIIGEVALSVVGTKGVDKVVKLTKGTRVVQEAGGARVLHHVVEDQPSPPGRAADIELQPPKAPETPSSEAKAVGEGTGKLAIDGLEVIDGKVLGKVPVDDFTTIRKRSIHNPDADSMVLGKYTPTIVDGKPDWSIPGPDSYIARAGNESTYFSLGSEWEEIKRTYGLTDNDMFELFNIPALDDAIASGKTIKFSHKPTLRIYKGSALAREWEYLKREYGYKRLIEERGYWVASKG